MTVDTNQETTRRAQVAEAVFMVRPASFGWNAETAASNRFQPAQAQAPAHDDASRRAVAEFDTLAAALATAGVVVHAFSDAAGRACPDAVFPNNWVSLHADGTVVLYPMLARSRRRERRLEFIAGLEQAGGHRVERLLDLTHHELQGHFLEGTGSVVFDHDERTAFACLSPRTDPGPLAELCDELGYAAVPLRATDRTGVPIYHTNVMLAIGSDFAVVCAEAVAAAERGALLERLGGGGRHVETITQEQMAHFAGNVLELRARDGARVLALSQRAIASYAPEARERLETRVDRVVAVPIPTLEDLGGGSVRCMLAEVFLPRRAPAPVDDAEMP